MTTSLPCEQARARLAELAESSGRPGGLAETSLVRHVESCSACATELRLARELIEAVGALARKSAPEPSEAYWASFLPAVRTRIDQRPGEPARPWTGRAVAAAAAVLMAAGAVGALLAPPFRPGNLASLRQADERMTLALSPDPWLSGEVSADLLGVDPTPGLGAVEMLEALRDIAPPPPLTGPWSGLEDGEMERGIDRLDKGKALRLVAELESSRG